MAGREYYGQISEKMSNCGQNCGLCCGYHRQTDDGLDAQRAGREKCTSPEDALRLYLGR
jgi:hypothetical protein